jgi:hypothetical protein
MPWSITTLNWPAFVLFHRGCCAAPASDNARMMGTLRSRIATAFGVGVLALVAALSLAFAAAGSAASVRDQSDTLQALARSTATLIADGLFERLREVRWLAATPPRDGVTGWAAALQKLQASRPHFSWIGVTDADGRVEVATGGLLVGRSVAERPWSATCMRPSCCPRCCRPPLTANRCGSSTSPHR